MNRAFKLLIAFFISFTSNAQNRDSAFWKNFPDLYSQPFGQVQSVEIINFSGDQDLSGRRINNQFIYPFLFGKKLSADVIDDNLKSDKEHAILGNGNTGITYINLKKPLFKTKNVFGYLKISSNNRVYANISNDAMRLMFKGNQDSGRYEFDEGQVQFHTYGKIGGGIFVTSSEKKKPFNLQAGLFIAQTFNYLNFETYNKNYLQGNEDSFRLGLNYKGLLYNNRLFSNRGYGLLAEIKFNQRLDQKRAWGFAIKDFGIFNLNKSLKTYESDGEYSFDGVWIAEPSRLGESGYFEQQLDSFTDPLTNLRENKGKVLLRSPVSELYFSSKLRNGYLTLSLKHFGYKTLPVAEIDYFTFLSRRLILGGSFGAGNFNYLNARVHYAAARKILLNLEIYHLESMVLPKIFGGIGACAGISILL